MNMKTEIFTKPTCPRCLNAKTLLKSKGVEFAEYPLGVDGVTKETIEAKIGAGAVVKTVPQIFLDGKYIGGYQELLEFYKSK